ncbi:hypothetical protein AR457_14325 [Streptomyces agglomeratus]|uniref:Uncharacterized protein n=1 Tax=Streptomyces agglomeratus TaxID=285458 RepID=A0A1E5P7L0_9ACTN|nr:hypothetical protein [Streptomyces agglomeratus]OEJ25457.1 hypothetical protein AS594_14140 [Streptomyces agglomeratus]OEJ45116.1 hypothetical protein AR457_14325 [Streptomyces agglomeratus]
MPRSDSRDGERRTGRRPPRFRHEFKPGKLISGLVVLGTAAAYTGDATGDWQIPAHLGLPVIFLGLLLAGAASWTAYSVRRRRAARAASTEKYAAPASTSGSQAMR